MRTLTGSLEHLEPAALLRLLSAIRPSGLLELRTTAGALRLEVVEGRAVRPSTSDLQRAAAVLGCHGGEFRFEPREVHPGDRDMLDLTALLEVAHVIDPTSGTGPVIADIEIERLLAGEIFELSRPDIPAIHVLPQAPPENPIDELLEELERTAPDELLLANVGVVASDPRIWSGPIGSAFRRRGWRIRVIGSAEELPVADLDVVVIHHHLAVSRAGREEEWLDLVRRVAAAGRPLVWVGPTADAAWVYRIVDAGAAFILPSPPGSTGEPAQRFAASLCRVIDRLVSAPRPGSDGELPASVVELVDTLVHGADADRSLGSLLQLASGTVTRGAVILVDETAFRLRAGFGYPLGTGVPALPRGVGVLERIVRSGAATEALDPDSGGAVQLARMLGLERLGPETCVIPLGSGGSIVGLIVGDREGRELPDLRELVALARRLGGLVVAG